MNMSTATLNPFSPGTDSYEIAQRLLSRPEPPPLLPARVYDPALTASIDQLAQQGDTAPHTNAIAALHLLNDNLDRAHHLVQIHEDDMTSCYLHAIIHRREGDWSNARYWVSRTGRHPFYEELFAHARAEANEGSLGDALQRWTRWEAGRMVDLCEGAARHPSAAAAGQVGQLAQAEMAGLLRWCVENGV